VLHPGDSRRRAGKPRHNLLLQRARPELWFRHALNKCDRPSADTALMRAGLRAGETMIAPVPADWLAERGRASRSGL